MKRPLLIPVLVGSFGLLFGACGGKPEELQGRPLVLQLGVKISTASTEQELDTLQQRVAAAKLGEGSRLHLNNALEAQRRLVANAAELDMQARMEGARKVMAEVEAASAAVE